MTTPQIWIIDDDPYYGPALKSLIEADMTGFIVRILTTVEELNSALDAGERPTSVVLDMMLPANRHDPNGGLPPRGGQQATGAVAAGRLIEAGVKPRSIAVITALMDDRYLSPLLDLGLTKENILIKPALVEEIKRALLRTTKGVKQRPE